MDGEREGRAGVSESEDEGSISSRAEDWSIASRIEERGMFRSGFVSYLVSLIQPNKRQTYHVRLCICQTLARQVKPSLPPNFPPAPF